MGATDTEDEEPTQRARRPPGSVLYHVLRLGALACFVAGLAAPTGYLLALDPNPSLGSLAIFVGAGLPFFLLMTVLTGIRLMWVNPNV